MNEIMSISRHRMGTDGKGVRTLVAFYGCPLSCRYCINRHCKQDKTARLSMSSDDLIGLVEKDNIYFKMTGGGITFGGGEPLLAAEFIRETAEKAPWPCDIETSLYAPWEDVEKLIPVIDEWYIDIKDFDSEIYKAYTGKDNKIVLDNLKKLKEAGVKMTIRVPYIEGFNTPMQADENAKIAREYSDKVDRFDYTLIV